MYKKMKKEGKEQTERTVPKKEQKEKNTEKV